MGNERKLKTFISGPMTGYAEYNHSAFDSKARELHEKGNIVINPATFPLGMDHDEYMHICYACIDIVDEVYFLYGWQYSRGARKEFIYAAKKGKRLTFEESIDTAFVTEARA